MTIRAWGLGLSGLLKLKLGTKVAAFMAVLAVANAAFVVIAGRWSLTDEFEAQARNQIEVNLRTLALAYAESVKDAKVATKNGKVARVEAPAMPAFTDHAIVDRATGYVSGTATIFVFDEASNQFVRRTTNVKKENGDRAVGTQLAPDHPGQAVVRRGEAYIGPAILFSQRYYTAYQPIMSPAGKPIGILYVGIPTAQYDAMLSHAVWMMAIAAAVGVLSIILITSVLLRRGIRPLVAVTDTMTALAAGDLDAKVEHVGRHDEIGAIARAVEVFKTNAIERRRLEADKHEAEHRADAARKAELQRFVSEFQEAVGGILEKVSRSSKQFEEVAGSLAQTAQTTQQLSGRAAGASEQASSHVQAAASASEELSSSIAEISRQVQESNRIAAEAVKQADVTDQRIAELSQAGTRIGDVVKLITSIGEVARGANETGTASSQMAESAKALSDDSHRLETEVEKLLSTMRAA